MGTVYFTGVLYPEALTVVCLYAISFVSSLLIETLKPL